MSNRKDLPHTFRIRNFDLRKLTYNGRTRMKKLKWITKCIFHPSYILYVLCFGFSYCSMVRFINVLRHSKTYCLNLNIETIVARFCISLLETFFLLQRASWTIAHCLFSLLPSTDAIKTTTKNFYKPQPSLKHRHTLFTYQPEL